MRTVPKKICFCLVVLQGLLCCMANDTNGQTGNSKKRNGIKPFEVALTNADYSMAYSVRIILTEKDIKVIFQSGLAEEKDSLLFSKPILPSDTLRQISTIKLGRLKTYYTNNCVSDGSQVTVTLKKEGKIKTVHLSNYYQDDIGKIIYFLNSLVPQKYKVWYDKEKLVTSYKRCNGSE